MSEALRTLIKLPAGLNNVSDVSNIGGLRTLVSSVFMGEGRTSPTHHITIQSPHPLYCENTGSTPFTAERLVVLMGIVCFFSHGRSSLPRQA
jgi:hypothetical protein